MKKLELKNSAIIKISCIFAIVIASFAIINLFTATTTLSNIAEVWDGVEVATSFSAGNGTKENPYQIVSGSELAYLKKIVEENLFTDLKEKYFVLANDIDLGGHVWQGIGTNNIENQFTGHIDGQGYSIKNFKIETPTVINNVDYYSFFNTVAEAQIENINFNNVEIKTTPSENPTILGLVAGKVNDKTTIKNIAIQNATINMENTLAKQENRIGGVIAETSTDTVVENIYVNAEIKDANANSFGTVFGTLKGKAKRIITQVTYTNFLSVNVDEYATIEEGATLEEEYQLVSNGTSLYIQNQQETSIESLLEILNLNIDSKYNWVQEELTLKIAMKQIVTLEQEEIPVQFAFGRSADIPLHESGITDTTVYINDLESDYNYYQGLNYTQSNTGALPTGNNQSLYSDSNLVKVYIKYSGEDINDNNLVGRVSLTEQQYEYIYYKYYVVENGYVTIELIDNPFANRPNNKGFNGWVTDYPNAEILFDEETYTRYVKTPITYTNGVPDTINITFYSSWLDANIYEMTRNNTWNEASNALKSTGMVLLTGQSVGYEDMSKYYVFGGNLSFGGAYPSGAYDNRLNSRENEYCFSFGGCTYYLQSDSSEYDPSKTYYRFNGSRLEEYTPEMVDSGELEEVPYGSLATGLYKEVALSNGTSLAGYYNSEGVQQTSGTCTQDSCKYYELEQYYNADGSLNTVTEGSNYYYFVTRDMNIVVARTDINTAWSISKPFTLTGIHNGNDYSDSRYYINNNAISISADTRIEYITSYTTRTFSNRNASGSRNAANIIYGNWHNLKIGRGIKTRGGNYVFADSIIGGGNNATGSRNDITRYKLIIESGAYNTTGIVNGGTTSNISDYVGAQAIYGNDYDRINNNNDNLEVYFSAVGSWGGDLHSSSDATDLAIDLVVKSGQFGTSKSDVSTGLYVGGRSYGDHYAPKRTIIEGGWIYNVNGGPLVSDDVSDQIATYTYMKGGQVDFIFGGAGTSETYGHRVIGVTGGTVNYSVFGGSNGYEGRTGDGTLSGYGFVYVGGNATIGNNDYNLSGSENWGVEKGSVFGIGNGKQNYDNIGSNSGSIVIIDKEATINGNVYGGGNYGYVGIRNQTTTNIKINGGTIKGSIYGGGNNNGAGTNNIDAEINIEMTAGTVEGSIYGGSRTKGTIYGNSTINILAGNIATDIYGGGEGGYTSSRSPGTFVRDNISVTIGNDISGPTINGNVYGGSAYGSVNGTSNNGSANNKTTNVTINQGVIAKSVFGGGKGNAEYTPKVYGNITVTINNGSIGNVFGGNDAAGSPSNNDVVHLNGGVIENAYGGGNQTGQTITNIYLQGSQVTKLFGGSNQSGTVNTANVYVSAGTSEYVYGGNNSGGTTREANVTITGGTVTKEVYGGGSKADTDETHLYLGNATLNDVYGGGESASATTTEATIEGATITNYYGGSNKSGTVDTTTTTMNSGNVGNMYGGNNIGGTSNTANITIENGTIGTIYGGGNQVASSFANININNGNITNIFGGGNEAGLNTSTINVAAGAIGNIYGGSNQSGNITQTTITTENNQNITINNIFGGNNMGGLTSNANLDIGGGVIGNIYGGGNEAEVETPIVDIENATVTNVFGGGNKARITGDTNVSITNSNILTNVYGGGNEGEVDGNTEVLLNGSTILGSAYAGGNGRTAIVNRNTTITVENNTVVGSDSSKAPHSGCVFGSGNAAATGTEAQNNSLATVNIVGAKIYGNVYGGANTSVVYGKTDTNIGTNAVNIEGLIETSIDIGGTVFGGGEANAAGDEDYDFSFISVTGAIDIDIDGKNYLNNNHDFIISGSIFGSGNASSSSGTSEIYIANLGTRENPSKNISIQRANTVILDNTTMELEGTTDRTNEYSDIEYSLNRIDELTIKNNTMLLLQRNANLLQKFRSTVDVDGKEEKATVIIDDDTKTVTKNVDNRLYLLANRNLNITTNEAATAYGEVYGMTFFGMYQRYGNGSFSYGLYEDSVNYGDSGDAGDIIVGGSYVLGLHSLNHDITVDGFYSNFIDDAYTEISTAYINPTPPDSNYYMWTIGISAINYSFAMTASKYSSLGTYELSMREFAKGDTTFEVIGFNSEGLTSGVELVDSNEVPKVADTEEDANSILGLSMKSETSEWTSYGTTKLLSENNGTYTGDEIYKTDSQPLAPSLMFYLYHAKNITLNQELGTVVVTLQAKTPINEIEYDVQLITITIDLVARNYDDGNSYDASITYDKKYEMPAATTVNITNQSQFTAYFDLFAWSDTFEDFYGRGNTYYHALVTDYALPVGTQITMLDYSKEGEPKYYYYTIDEAEYNRALQQLETDNEITYRLSNFIKMGSTSENNTYDDKFANKSYYDEEKKRTMEEFLFIFDFKNTNITGNELNKYMRFELRNQEDRTVITVLGIRQNLMYFNLYESSNMVLNQEVTPDNNYIYPGTARHIAYSTGITYDQTGNRESIINTNYESTSMGLNVTLYDQSGTQISSSLLTGTSIRMDGVEYFADSEGVFRIKLAGKVSNLNKDLYFLTDENLPAGNYKMTFTLFASSDGLHNSGNLQYVEKTLDVTVVPSDNAIKVTGVDEQKVINGITRLNEQDRSDATYRITTTQNLTSPNLRVALYKRNIDNKDTTAYTEVSMDEVFVHTLTTPIDNGLTPGTPNELMVGNTVGPQTEVTMSYAETLTSGTYRIVFRLYDQNQLIDEDHEYIIIKKLE